MFVVRYDKCVGFSFPAIGRFKIELWWVPKNYEIVSHSHPNIDIEFIPIYGDCIDICKWNAIRACHAYIYNRKNLFRRFSIRAGDIHTFKTSATSFVFINIEIWKRGVKPTSAAEDFEIYAKKT